MATLGPVGGVIEGSFAATVVSHPASDGGAPIPITGKFRVCRDPDQFLQ